MFQWKPHFYSTESYDCVIYIYTTPVVMCNFSPGKINAIYAAPISNEVFNVALRRKCLPTPGLNNAFEFALPFFSSHE